MPTRPRSLVCHFGSFLLLTIGAVAQTTTPISATVVPVTATQTMAAVPATPAVATVTAPISPTALPDAVLRPVGTAALTSSIGETAITLDIGNGIRAVPPSRVTVPAGEILLITGPSFGGRPVQWLKDGRALPNATGTLLALQRVTSADAGTYQLVNQEPNVSSIPSQLLILGVGPTDRLLNLSVRGILADGPGQSFITGFVVAAAPSSGKRLILRAVGPTLAAFGVTNPLRAPVLRLFDAAGKPYTNGYVYPAVLGGPTYESDLAESLARTGAFPIPAGTLDAVVMMPFLPGAYTAQITSADNTPGTVLIEIYEVP